MINFTQKDFNSKDGMLTSVWGPVMWHMLHTISFNYPCNPTKEQISDYYKFFKKLQKILPCGTCRDNLVNNYKTLNFGKHYFKSRDTLSRFVYLLHETINNMLGKKSKLTYEAVRNKYELLRARCIDKKNDEPVCKKNHKGCSEWLHGTGDDKPCTYIVITSGKNNNNLKQMLNNIKDNNTNIGNENDCKILIGKDIINKCSRRSHGGRRKQSKRKSQRGGRKNSKRKSQRGGRKNSKRKSQCGGRKNSKRKL